MKAILINSIYPNPVEPTKGNFILKNLMHYPEELKLEVIAPVPFFLSRRRRSPKRVPLLRYEDLGSRKIRIWHPRFLLLPRNILRPLVPYFEYLSVKPLLWLLKHSQKIDLLHANFAMPDGVACYKLSQRYGIPFLITEHQGVLAEYLANPRLKKLMLPAYLAARHVIAVSAHTQSILQENGVPNVRVIPNGIDTALFQPATPAVKIQKLIYIGNLVPDKGVQILLKALAILKDSTLQISIIGDGVYRQKLEALSSELGLEAQVSFLGEKNPSELAQLLNQHHALVHPSFIESFGITVVEAMASGLPVLATINGGSEHIIRPGTGILVPPRDEKALAKGISELLATSWDHDFIRSYAAENYDIKSVVKDTISLYPSSVKRICHLSSVHIRTDVRVFYKQCMSLAKAGWDTHLIVADGKAPQLKNQVKIHSVGRSKNRPLRMLLSPLKLLLKALQLKADLYQFHDPELIPMALLLRAISGKPVIYDVHESYPEMFLHKEYLKKWQSWLFSRLIRRLEAVAYKAFDATIAATEHIASQFPKALVLHNYPLKREWDGSPADPVRYHSKNICYLGSITRERGIGQLVKALPDVDCTLHLAGSYEPKSFRDELATLPGFEKVIEYGYLNRDEATQLLAKCAIGVVFFDRSPNHLYSLSTKMFEYMAAGLPILVSDLPANVELLKRAQCGRYLDPAVPQNISRALNELLAQPESLAEMGEKGKNMISNELSWEAEEPAYIALINAVSNGRKHENPLS